MPGHVRLPRFDRDWDGLAPADRGRFRVAATRLLEDLQGGAGMGGGGSGGSGGTTAVVRTITGAPGVVELRFAPDGHATLSVGRPEGRPPSVIWRRVGTGSGLGIR